MSSVRHIQAGLLDFYSALFDQQFRKTLHLHKYSERQLLPLLRAFLRGRYGDKLGVEVDAALPGAKTTRGRLDFTIGDTAMEFAVRRPDAPQSNLSATVNHTEVKKLLKWRGRAVLVLFDFSNNPYEPADLEERFRDWRSVAQLGKGNHALSPFCVAYFNRGRGRLGAPQTFLKQIRVR